jgi:hypothetical protein
MIRVGRTLLVRQTFPTVASIFVWGDYVVLNVSYD